MESEAQFWIMDELYAALDRDTAKIVAFNMHKLASLNAQELNMFRTAFSENKHPRFMKECSFHDRYGRSKFFKSHGNRRFTKASKTHRHLWHAIPDQSVSLLKLGN